MNHRFIVWHIMSVRIRDSSLLENNLIAKKKETLWKKAAF